jgi:hypothetical protein
MPKRRRKPTPRLKLNQRLLEEAATQAELHMLRVKTAMLTEQYTALERASSVLVAASTNAIADFMLLIGTHKLEQPIITDLAEIAENLAKASLSMPIPPIQHTIGQPPHENREQA